MSTPAYNRMGLNYSDFRQPDPRIAAAIWKALGDARSVVNVGAGAGSYEPTDREVVAVEPSPVMIAQRPPEAAPALEGIAEALPLDDKSVDAWDERHGHLRTQAELDIGLRLVREEL